MIHTVLGHRGYGKTYRLRRLVIEYSRRFPTLPVLIHDTRGRQAGTVARIAPADATWSTVDEFIRRGLVDQDGQTRLRRRYNAFVQCTAEDVCALAGRLMYGQRGSILVIDELDQLPGQLVPGWKKTPRGHQPYSWAYHVLHYGRIAPVVILGSARQPQNLDKAWMSQADQIDFFCCATRQILSQIKESGWPAADRIAESLPRLPKHYYVSVKP